MLDSQVDLRDALYDVIQPITGLSEQNVIWDYATSPQPNPPYVTLGTTGLRKVGQPYEGPVDALGVRSVFQTYRWSVRINVYGPNALGLAHNLDFSFEKVTNRELLHGAGFSYLGTTEVLRSPHLINTEWEERALFDLLLAFEASDTDDVGYIMSVGISGDYARYPEDPDPIDASIGPIITI